MNTIIFMQETKENNHIQFTEVARLSKILMPRIKERIILKGKKFSVVGVVYDYDNLSVTVVLRSF